MLEMKLLRLIVSVFGLLVFIGVFIFIKVTGTYNPKPICDRCNVILISLDTLGSNHLPCYGYDRNTAPNLCSFAKENILFSNSFSNASWTRPSHFSIFTSLYPNHHGMVSNDDDYGKFSPNISTMTEYFKKANYKTVYAGTLVSPSLPINEGLGRGFDTLLEENSNWDLSKWKVAINQMKTNDSERTFLFLHTYWVHYPYFVDNVSQRGKRLFTEDYFNDIPLFSKENINTVDFPTVSDFSTDFLNFLKTEKGIDIASKIKGEFNPVKAKIIYEEYFSSNDLSEPTSSDYFFYKMSKTSERVAYGKALYDEMIYYLDKQLSEIFDLVSSSELAKNTIIIITSDHGEGFMEHGSMSHPADQLYNTITSVPLIMYIPGVKQKKVENLVQSIDILPTVLNLTGVNDDKNIFDGIDLTGLITGKIFAKKNDYLISEGPGVDTVRDDQWKLYVKDDAADGNTSYELFNLLKDPFEKINQSQKEALVVKRLEEKLKRIIYKK